MVEITINLERRTMKGRHRLAKRDIIVALVSVALLLINLGLIGSTGRRKAKEAVCRSNLRQWGIIFQEFTNDNDGYFWDTDGRGWPHGKWITAFYPHLETWTNILRCPEATERLPSGANYGGPFNTYVMGSGGSGARWEETSYGENVWIDNPLPGITEIQNRPTKFNWRTPHVKGTNMIPVFADTMWRGGGPYEVGTGANPPAYDGEWAGYNKEMKHFCIDRHNERINHLFMDWSVRKVGLKELWTLKWHRLFSTSGPWTMAGGVLLRDWPEWMRDFKPY